MEKWICLLWANVFPLRTTLPHTVVFPFTLTFSLGANDLSDNVTLSINKRVKTNEKLIIIIIIIIIIIMIIIIILMMIKKLILH